MQKEQETEYRIEHDSRWPHPFQEESPCFECKHYNCNNCKEDYQTWELYE